MFASDEDFNDLIRQLKRTSILTSEALEDTVRDMQKAGYQITPPLKPYWRDIESAPKDGTIVLIHDPEHGDQFVVVARYSLVEKMWTDGYYPDPYNPTLWMPLPRVPSI